jgi:hypothetical protein
MRSRQRGESWTPPLESSIQESARLLLRLVGSAGKKAARRAQKPCRPNAARRSRAVLRRSGGRSRRKNRPSSAIIRVKASQDFKLARRDSNTANRRAGNPARFSFFVRVPMSSYNKYQRPANRQRRTGRWKKLEVMRGGPMVRLRPVSPVAEQLACSVRVRISPPQPPYGRVTQSG